MTINKCITPYNRWVGRDGHAVEWIVIHYTANVGDTAKGNAEYFASRYFGSSAHFFVDKKEIWQSVELTDTAWHCGDNPPPKNGCTNRTSIGIEMCTSYKDGNYYIEDAVVNNTIELVEYLLESYPTAKLCRHYDVTGKRCPEPFVREPALWEDFLKKVEENPMTADEKKQFNALKAEVAALKSKLNSNIETTNELEDKVAVVDERTEVKYRYINEVPDWGRPTIQKCYDKGFLKGEDGNLALTYELVRELVINDRAGVFDL